MYRYPAAKNYVGSDEVEIETSRGSDGVSPSTEIEIIRIKFPIIAKSLWHGIIDAMTYCLDFRTRVFQI